MTSAFERPDVGQWGAASGQGRVYQAGGDQSIREVHLPAEALRPVDQVAAPPGLLNVPDHPLFIGRSDELARLAAYLSSPGTVVVAAVHGLGGVGKSTLAAHHARAAARSGEASPVWWITADTPASLQAGLAALATALQPELAEALPLEALAERAIAWLTCHHGWLLVLDNVTTPADVEPMLRRLLTGRVLVTSRLGQGWQKLHALTVQLDVLPADEAIDLLTRVATGSNAASGLEGAAELADALGCLPLAIEQAGAYLAQAGLTPAAYLELLTDQPEVMYDRAAEGSDSERTIARIWRITLDHLADRTPLTGDLLRILAWYAPEAIPRTHLAALNRALPAATSTPTRRRRWRLFRSRTPTTPAQSPAITDATTLTDALGLLAAYNMITLDADTITVHRLVQAVARIPDPHDPHRHPTAIDHAREQATVLLNQAGPADVDDPAGWPTWRALLPHIDALADHTDPANDSVITGQLLDRTATFLQNQGAITRAIAYFERALTTKERLHGPDHPNTLASRNNLAYAYELAGDLAQAIPLHETTLTACQRVLGADHPSTLTSRNNLAAAYHSAGDLTRAIPLYQANLADRERVLGDDHPSTLTSRNNLAAAYRAADDLERATPLYQANLTDRERVLGDDHPDTLTSRNNLAAAYRAAGDLGRAISLYQASLTDRERILGPDHPDTLNSRNNLAAAYRAAGDLERAIPLYQANLTDRERILGPDHPNTLNSRNNLAYAYQTAGDLARAIPLYQATLTDRERVLGADHPATLGSRNNLAGAYQTAGDLARAIPLYETTLTDRERVLGANHPATLGSRNNLAAAYRAAGDLGRAISLYEAALADCERVLGGDHPTTKLVRANLEVARGELG
ncbi:tetratricopeptide repeat-containing protein [Actinomadura fulvescens]|uniref:FxSxx-COOH system tetratricopeptide repeat protein n=1 Tax=Actinomadura fulvescens TaxID=46160 RepID=A0ABN3QX50_9ACTN